MFSKTSTNAETTPKQGLAGNQNMTFSYFERAGVFIQGAAVFSLSHSGT
jgi:hypothetical protein